MTTATTLGIVGAGSIGSQVARKAVEAGYDVSIANSRGPETLAALAEELGPRTRAATAAEAAGAGDVVVLAIPLGRIDEVPAEQLAGKIVLDANNYFPDRDGKILELEDGSTTTSEIVQARLPTSRVVKAFNHIWAPHITRHAEPDGWRFRRALGFATDDPEARAFVAKLYDEFGFDAVDAGPLAEGWRMQFGFPGWVQYRTAAQLAEDFANAKRNAGRPQDQKITGRFGQAGS